ncbi:MAG TPA: MBL fold metallo-hydrolase [Planctomycetota bacterium]|nr:MBL fold metallo-hydrolase [Planctomycetota bacterium]
MQLRFLGAVRTTTGSMHLLSVNGARVLLDCGLFQGKRKEAFERNRSLPFDASGIHAVVLSHAHIDHSGNLPTLHRRGFRGPVYATPATADLCDIMLRDSAYLQMRDVEFVNKRRKRQGKNPFEPLYELQDVEALLEQFEPAAYGEARRVAEGVSITFHDAGHILGSALTDIHVQENGSTHRLLFTGDLGRPHMPILRDPVIVRGAETLITESTYGNRVHPSETDVSAKLAGVVNEVCEARSKLIIPAFSVGRTQQLLYYLDLLHGARRICPLPVYVDSPLSTRATAVHERHAECFDRETLARLRGGNSPFAFPALHFVTDVEDSKALNTTPGPMVIISASGMCEGGRIVHHLHKNIEDPSNIVLFVGYQAENTLGRYLVEGHKTVRIFGEEHNVRAQVAKINALSAHADRNELLSYYRAMQDSLRRAFVVHGEMANAEALAASMRDQGIPNVTIPEVGQTFTP